MYYVLLSDMLQPPDYNLWDILDLRFSVQISYIHCSFPMLKLYQIEGSDLQLRSEPNSPKTAANSLSWRWSVSSRKARSWYLADDCMECGPHEPLSLLFGLMALKFEICALTKFSIFVISCTMCNNMLLHL